MTDANGPQQEFPLRKVLLAAAATPLALGMLIVRKSVPGILALGIGYAIALLAGVAAASGNTSDLVFFALIAVLPLFIYSYTIIAVTMHRIFLLGPDAVPGNGFTRWTYRETRFFGWGIAIGFTAGLAGMLCIAVVVSQVGVDFDAAGSITNPTLSFWTFVGLLPMAWLLGRLAFVLPATATGAQPSFGWSWEFSRRYQWQTMLVVGVTPLAINLVVELLASVLPVVVIGVISVVAGVYLAIFGIAALSFSYRTLCELQPDLPPPPLENPPAQQ